MNLERLDGEYALSDARSSHISKIISEEDGQMTSNIEITLIKN